LEFLVQENQLGQDKGLRVRETPRLLKSRHRKGDTAFVRYAPLPFLARQGKTLSPLINRVGSGQNIM
jgi:hypothetical protein